MAMGAGAAAAAASSSCLSALRSICGRRGPPSPGLARRMGEGFLTPIELTVSHQNVDKSALRGNKVQYSTFCQSKEMQQAWQIHLYGQLKESHLPSLPVFLSGVLTGGGRCPGDVKEKLRSGVTGGAGPEVPGGVEGLSISGGGGGGSEGVSSSPSILVAVGMAWFKYVTSTC